MVDPVGFYPVGRSRAATDTAPSVSPSAVPQGQTEDPQVKHSVPRLLAMAQQLAEAGPPIDHAKIAQIRQAIAQGNFHIDPREIAAAMLSYGRKPTS